MTRQSPEQPLGPAEADYSFYATDGRAALSGEERVICDETFVRICGQLPAVLDPARIDPDNQVEFTYAVHRIMDNNGIEELPTLHVTRGLKAYYSAYPPGTGLTPAQYRHKLADQNLYIPLAQREAKAHPAVTDAANFLLACRARKFPAASAAMYGLLTVYGQTIEALGSPNAS